MTRLAYRSLQSPPAIESSADNVSISSNDLGPFAEIAGSSGDIEAHVPACVSALLKRCRPTDVAWLISLLSIDSINRMMDGWAWPDMGKELFKGIDPFRTDRDPSATVSVEALVVSIQTTALHGAPRSVLRRVCLSVALASFAQLFPVEASTGSRIATSQIQLSRGEVAPAIASAHPPTLFVCAQIGQAHYEKPSVSMSGEVSD